MNNTAYSEFEKSIMSKAAALPTPDVAKAMTAKNLKPGIMPINIDVPDIKPQPMNTTAEAGPAAGENAPEEASEAPKSPEYTSAEGNSKEAFARGFVEHCVAIGMNDAQFDRAIKKASAMDESICNALQMLNMRKKADMGGSPQHKPILSAVDSQASAAEEVSSAAQFMRDLAKRKMKGRGKKDGNPSPDVVYKSDGNQLAIKQVHEARKSGTGTAPNTGSKGQALGASTSVKLANVSEAAKAEQVAKIVPTKIEKVTKAVSIVPAKGEQPCQVLKAAAVTPEDEAKKRKSTIAKLLMGGAGLAGLGAGAYALKGTGVKTNLVNKLKGLGQVVMPAAGTPTAESVAAKQEAAKKLLPTGGVGYMGGAILGNMGRQIADELRPSEELKSMPANFMRGLRGE